VAAARDVAVSPPPPADEVVAQLTSEPPGATVFRRGQRKGVTPLSLRLPRGEGQAALELRLKGYQRLRLNVSLDADSAHHVELVRRAQVARDRGGDAPAIEGFDLIQR